VARIVAAGDCTAPGELTWASTETLAIKDTKVVALNVFALVSFVSIVVNAFVDVFAI
jgi:hypothetical protein